MCVLYIWSSTFVIKTTNKQLENHRQGAIFFLCSSLLFFLSASLNLPKFSFRILFLSFIFFVPCSVSSCSVSCRFCASFRFIFVWPVSFFGWTWVQFSGMNFCVPHPYMFSFIFSVSLFDIYVSCERFYFWDLVYAGVKRRILVGLLVAMPIQSFYLLLFRYSIHFLVWISRKCHFKLINLIFMLRWISINPWISFWWSKCFHVEWQFEWGISMVWIKMNRRSCAIRQLNFHTRHDMKIVCLFNKREINL